MSIYIYYATIRGHILTLRILLLDPTSIDAINEKDSQNKSALDMALQNEDGAVLALLKFYEADNPRRISVKDLLKCSLQGSPAAVNPAQNESGSEDIISNDTDVELTQRTPLHWSIWRDSWVTTTRLLNAEEGNNSNTLLSARDSHGQTALHYAVNEGRIEMIQLLLKHGADKQARD